MTAKIIQLPGAAVSPVVQKNGPGRNPKMIVKMFELQRRRWVEVQAKKIIATEIESMKSSLAFLDRSRAMYERNLRSLTAPAMTKDERQKLVAQIEYDRLPWQEKERIDAHRAELGKVVFPSGQ
jgi:hypothetical protein